MSDSQIAEPLRPRLRRALLAAMKTRDLEAVSALRSALAAIDNAEAVPPPRAPTLHSGVMPGAVGGLGAGEAPRLDLSEDQIAAIIRAEVADRSAAAAQYEEAGQLDQAARLSAQAAVLITHLREG